MNGYINKNEAKMLVEKWKPMLDYTSDKVRPIEDDHTRVATAMMMENQQKYLIEANMAGDGGVYGASLQGTPGQGGAVPGGSDFYATGDARLPKVLIPMIRRTFPELITNEIVGVQPMSGPVGLAFALRYRQGATALGQQQAAGCGDTGVAGVAGSCGAQSWWPATTGTTAHESTNAEMGWNYLNNSFTGRVSPVLSAQNASTSAAFELHPDDYGVAQLLSQFEMTSQIPTMEISFEKTAVEAGTRRLAAKWSVELEQDVKNMNGIDLDSELTNTMSYEIQAEIDREMIIRMIRTCLNAQSGRGYSFWYAASADARWLGERGRDFYARVIVEANRIAIRNRRGPANFIIATPRVCAMLEMLPEFKWMPVNGNVNTQPTGIAKVGSVGGRFNIYRDTRTEAQWSAITPNAYRSNPVEYALLGYKGPEFYDTGIVYCPYIPVMIQRTIGPNDFAPRVGLMTRYGVVDNLFGADLYYHMIIVKGLGTGFAPGVGTVYL